MKLEFLLLSMLIFVTKSTTDTTPCTNVQLGDKDEDCYNVELASGYCCTKKEEKETGEEERICVVLDSIDQATLQAEAEKILREKNLGEFKYDCKGAYGFAQSEEKKRSEALEELCESKGNPAKGDDCEGQFNSSVIEDGYHCCYWYKKKGEDEEKKCKRLPQYYYEILKSFVSGEVIEEELDEFEVDCGTGYKLVTSDSSGNPVESISGKNETASGESESTSGKKETTSRKNETTSATSFLKTGIIISIFALLI